MKKKDRLLTLDAMRNISGVSGHTWVWVTARMTQLLLGPPRRVRVELEGLENLPDGPVIFAANHTHTYDFLPLRIYLYLRRGLFGSTWIKARAWQNPVEKFYFSRTGNVPLGSKGYVLAADFKRHLGRRPSEAEYRVLRRHLDAGTPLPDEPLYESLMNTPREILGRGFQPSTSTYRDAVLDCFFEMMQISLRIARESRDAGQYQHINPQGARSSRLTEGKTGVMHASRALNLAIVPTAICGMKESLPNEGLKSNGGTILIRFGTPYMPELDGLPADYRPFDPRTEGAVRPLFEAQTAALMTKIDALCTPAYRYQADFVSDATSGTARFL